MSEKQLEEIVKEYADLAKDKNVDVSALMINALQQQDQNKLNPKTKRWAYLLSLGFPPLGYIFGFWYYFKDESDARTTAYICIALTTFSIVLSIIFFNVILSSSGTSLQQIQQIKPEEVYQLIE